MHITTVFKIFLYRPREIQTSKFVNQSKPNAILLPHPTLFLLSLSSSALSPSPSLPALLSRMSGAAVLLKNPQPTYTFLRRRVACPLPLPQVLRTLLVAKRRTQRRSRRSQGECTSRLPSSCALQFAAVVMDGVDHQFSERFWRKNRDEGLCHETFCRATSLSSKCPSSQLIPHSLRSSFNLFCCFYLRPHFFLSFFLLSFFIFLPSPLIRSLLLYLPSFLFTQRMAACSRDEVARTFTTSEAAL